MILPESLSLKVEALLLGDLDCSHGLPGILFRVPDLAGILDRLVVQILTQLDLKEVLCVVCGMEVLEPALTLCLTRRHQAVLHNIISEAVGGLRVLASALQMGIAHFVARSLQFSVVALLEVNDLTGDFGSGKVEGWSAVELNVVCGVVLIHVTLDTEELHGKASRNRDTPGSPGSVLYLAAIGYSPPQVVVDDESALDDSMCASMGTAIAMTVDVPLGFLNQVDLFGDGIDIVLLVFWDLLYTFSIPTNIVSTGEVFLLDIVGVLVWSFIEWSGLDQVRVFEISQLFPAIDDCFGGVF
ncbi:heme-dependent catalase, partial [Aureobasidium melanogenum]